MKNFARILFFCFALQAPLWLHAQDLLIPAVKENSDTSAANETLRVNDIRIQGNKKTKQYVIAREIFFQKGDVISKKELEKLVEKSRNQLVNTQLFISVDISLVPVSSSDVNVLVQVKERWYIFPLPYFKLVDRNFNQWWVEQKRDLERVNYGVKFTYSNVSGRNDKLRLYLINGYSKQLQLTYTQPYLDKKLRHGMSLGIGYAKVREVQYATTFNKQSFFPDTAERKRMNLDFVRELFRVDAAYIFRPGFRERYFFRTSFVSESINDSVAAKNPDYFGQGRTKIVYPEFFMGYQYQNVDYLFYPTRGFFGDIGISLRDPFGRLQLYELTANGNGSFKLFKNAYLNTMGSFNIKLPFNQPFYNRRLMGYGGTYLRGLEYYVIDGVMAATLRNTIKYKVLDFSVKTPFIKSKTHDRIPIKIFLKAFNDLGYAYSRPQFANSLNNKLLYTSGVGIDVVSFYDIVIKIDFSFNQFGESGLFLHSRLE